MTLETLANLHPACGFRLSTMIAQLRGSWFGLIAALVVDSPKQLGDHQDAELAPYPAFG